MDVLTTLVVGIYYAQLLYGLALSDGYGLYRLASIGQMVTLMIYSASVMDTRKASQVVLALSGVLSLIYYGTFYGSNVHVQLVSAALFGVIVTCIVFASLCGSMRLFR